MSIRLCLCAGLLMGLSAGAQTGSDKQVRTVVQQYLDARNHADEAKTRALFTEDADQLVSSGEWRHGRDNLVKGAMASSRKESGTSRIQIDAVRFLTDNIAIADGDYETNSVVTGASPPRKMRTTFILKRARRCLEDCGDSQHASFSAISLVRPARLICHRNVGKY